MRFFFIIFLFASFGFLNSFSQKIDTIKTKHDFLYRETNEISKVEYLRECYKSNGLWIVKYYKYNDKKLKKIISFSILDSVREGYYVDYYLNNKKEKEGYYLGNIQVGEWMYWYSNGNLASQQYFISDIDSVLRILSTDSIIRRTIINFSNRFNRRYYHGIRNGINKWYHENGVQSSEEVYSEGILLEAKFWNKKGASQERKIIDKYDFNEEMNSFKLGDFNSYISKYMVYPPAALRKKIKGLVILRFNVNDDGDITNIHTTHSSNYIFDNEAKRLLKLTNGLWYQKLNHNLYRDSKYENSVSISFNVPTSLEVDN